MPNLFFTLSNATYDQVTEIFDFLWPTAAGMWNLRWQVRGYVETVPNATNQDLSNRFIHGSNIHGANLKRACIEHSWEQQEAQLSKFLLVNIFAIYESWLKELLDDIGVSKYEKALQFPTAPSGSNGVIHAVSAITTTKSQMIQQSFYPSLTRSKKYSWSKIDNLMKCYRYFKECRNCLMHNGGLADEKLERAYQEFTTVATEAGLGVKEVPIHNLTTKNQPVKIYLRGVVGFCDVILRIITTLDAEMAQAKSAEREIFRRWTAKYGSKQQTIKSVNPVARQKQLVSLAHNIGYPRTTYSIELESYLLSQSLVI